MKSLPLKFKNSFNIFIFTFTLLFSSNLMASFKEFSMVFASDTQLVWGKGDTKEEVKAFGIRTNREHAQAMNRLSSLPEIGKPKGVIINGDLTAFGHPWQWKLFNKIYIKGTRKAYPEVLQLPLYLGLGNHDYSNNVNDCWGYWYSIFTDGKNWCARNSIRIIEKFVEKNKSKITSFDKGSVAYSFDIDNIHFVQLHNYPGYERKEIKIKNSFSWLKKDLDRAAKLGKKIVINLHDMGGKTKNDKRFLNALKGKEVIGIFAGHIHSHLGEVFSINIDGRDIPVFRSKAAEHNKFLVVKFQEDYMIVYKVDSKDGTPEILEDIEYNY